MPSNTIFQGVTTAPCRDFVAKEILSTAADTVYMPCVGSFAAAQAFIKHGGNRAALRLSDISLYSSMIGYMADSSKCIDDLKIVNTSHFQPESSEDLDLVSAAMLAIRYSQVNASTKYGMNIRNELIANRQKYLSQIKATVADIITALSGAAYEVADVRDVAREARGNQGACLYVNVPTYAGGYERMFAASGVSWAAPSIEQFKYADFEALLADLEGCACHVLVYFQKSLKHAPDGWRAIYAQEYGPERTDYIISNRDPSASYALRKGKQKPYKVYPVYNDEEITESSQIEFVKADEATALHYRDLFVHKLGSTQATDYYLMLIDGRVATALGLHTRDLYLRKTQYVSETFGISKSSNRHKRLGKLFMLCLTCGDFRRMIEGSKKLALWDIIGVKTTSLTTHWEGKTDRSVMKMASREKLDNGQYKIVYQADFREETYADCLQVWLKKWGDVGRGKASGNKV